jgi:hypothetical protein
VRIAVVDTYYPAFLASHYAGEDELAGRPYDAQLASLIGRCFGTSDAYSRHLGELGHETVDLVVNCFPLQQRWAAEHGKSALLRLLTAFPGRLGTAARRRFLRQVAQAQIAAFDPDVVYVQDLWFFTGKELAALRRQGRLVVGQIASQAPPFELLRGYGLITTSFPHYVGRFRAAGIDAEYLKIAFYERVLERLTERGAEPDPHSDRSHGVSFIGGLNPSVHGPGTALLERLVGEVPLEVWGYGIEGLSGDSPLRAHYRGEAWGLEMYEVLSRSRISINRHIEAAEGYANNMRMFETTGTGALLLTEAAPNLGDLFEPGSELVAYKDESDLVKKVRHYLEHEDERIAIAAAGQARTLGEHTYARRMAELAEMLESQIG